MSDNEFPVTEHKVVLTKEVYDKLVQKANRSDKLDQIFEAQEKFRKLMGKGKDCIVDLMDETQKGILVYDHIQAIQSELQELINTIYWKSWTKEAKEGNRFKFRSIENAKEEIADILCFLGDICAAVGMGAEELAAINVRKTEINIQRQLTKYAMDTKDGKDSEAIWKDIADGKLKSLDQKESTSSPSLTAKYLTEQPDRVTILVNPNGKILTSNPPINVTTYQVTLESTNETKEIDISEQELVNTPNKSPRAVLMSKISQAFGLTKSFEIVEL